MRKLLILLALVLLLALAACGGDSAPTTSDSEGGATGPGDAAAGEAIFGQSLIGTQAGCATCHSLEPGVTMVGPSMATIGADAGSRVSGVSAEDYLRKSITDPNADIADGFAAGLMPAALADELTEEQVSDLIAFLLTLK